MAKVLLFPLRLAVGWGLSPRLLGLIGVTMLVLLRLAVGLHFYTEGLDKKRSGDWSAVPFFANASGPFAAHYRDLVWDADGALRLDRDRTMVTWAQFREQVAAHYGFTEQQKAEAQENYAKAVEQYDWVLQEHAADLEEFRLGRERIERLESDTREREIRDAVDSLGGQRETIRREWNQKAATALEQIDTIWRTYEVAQNAVATPEQAADTPSLRLIKPRTHVIDTSVIDGLVPYFDLAVGVCLLFGLFTPVAALAAAGFLGSVFLSQYPPEPGPGSTYYQLVEAMACLVLAGTGAGRFAGLDYFLHLLVRKAYSPATTDAS